MIEFGKELNNKLGGAFVNCHTSSGIWKIWVEYNWLDDRYPTLESKAREIYKSGWCKKSVISL